MLDSCQINWLLTMIPILIWTWTCEQMAILWSFRIKTNIWALYLKIVKDQYFLPASVKVSQPQSLIKVHFWLRMPICKAK